MALDILGPGNRETTKWNPIEQKISFIAGQLRSIPSLLSIRLGNALYAYLPS